MATTSGKVLKLGGLGPPGSDEFLSASTMELRSAHQPPGLGAAEGRLRQEAARRGTPGRRRGHREHCG
eukprot:6189536-Alexandrium_andersonii.AAC.1